MSFQVAAGRYKDLDKTYTDNKVAAVIDQSPESLDTLNELAAAINDDPAFFTSMSTANATLQSNIDAVQANVDALTTAASDARDALQALLQADIDQNESDADAAILAEAGTRTLAIAAVQSDVDSNEAERKTYFKWESNLTKVVNPLRSSEIEIGNNIHIDPAAGYATQFDGNVEFDNNTVLSHGGTDLTATFAEINGFDARIDTLEADPTTATAVAAVQADVDQNEADADAAIALKAPLADPDFTGVLEVDTNARLEFADNLTKLHNVLRGTSIKIGNNIEMNPAAAGGRVEITGDLLLDISDVTNAADDTAAATAGVAVGQVYRNGSVLMIRVS